METIKLTRDQAIALSESLWWVGLSDREVTGFQLFVEDVVLCMPFKILHGCVERALGRPVWTHEFAYPHKLRKEFLGEKHTPTIDDIMALVPEEKRIILKV